MTSIYSDDQRQSLMNSMTNPESNAVKFLEQGGETGLSPDITMDILNKYATYGANTGIGNIGGSRLVDALNEEYRKQVDAPLQSSSPKAFDGASTSRLQQQQQQLLQQQQQQQTIQDLMTTPVAPVSDPSLVPTEEMKADLDDALANPVELGQLSPTETAVQEGIDKDVNPEISPITIVDGEEGRISKLKKYLKDNPLLAEQLMKSGASLGSILGKAAVGNDKGGRTPRAPRGGQKASRVTYAPIGMQAGGETAGAEGAAGPNAGLMAILQALGSILGQSLVGRDKTKRISPAVKPKSHTLTSIDGDELAIGMNEGGKTPEGSVLGRKMFIEGGEVDGPGGPREDMVPIWASNKEYVMSHNGVKRMGGGDFEQGIAALDKVNKNGVA